MPLLNRFLRWLSLGVYGSFVPLEHNPGAEMYLCDLWKIAPKRVAFAHTVLALIPLFIGPFLLKKPCLYPALALEQKEQIQHKLMFSKWYLLRLVAYGLRGHALVATLRDEKVRTKILQDSPLTQRGSHGADYKRSLG